ncbi:hypothetical protein, partial [Ferviditalea candida]|nr:hypothetical protein [Paenibacillaceae bacterium T2]
SLDFVNGCVRLHLKGAPLFVDVVLVKHHSIKDSEHFSYFQRTLLSKFRLISFNLDWLCTILGFFFWWGLPSAE